MRIEHVAFWTDDLERLADFYATYFGATTGPKYVNPAKHYESRFLSFEGGARIEVMRSSALDPVKFDRGAQRMGLAHLAIAVGSKQAVDDLTIRLKRDGFEVVDGPRYTGDGYYECVVLDPDGNRVEVTI
ncbi:MAG TPA: VOC family protein [Steroidobacteraceae bacterium]|jgi:lactoylglutathione lyase